MRRTHAESSAVKRPRASVAVASTSLWSSRVLERPAARLVMQDTAATRTPMCRSAMTSGTVLMPTASAPRVRSMRISAGVS